MNDTVPTIRDDGRWSRPDLAIWGGFECSVVRIGEVYRDQLVETGHVTRAGDLEAAASLGLRTLRYPCLWERINPELGGDPDWHWQDRQMLEMRRLGIAPVLGLVHHGSGPRHTDLLRPDFASGLARHARLVAERYPWVRAFVPVNEPLTTARFSALYGHWYPHARDMRSFCRALVTQCRATVLSMEAIRSVTPDAQLVQTEDVGRVFSTPSLRYQAEYENERRWLSLDLLFGRVDRRHPWFAIFCRHGIEEGELLAFLERPCPPDVIAVNYYLTSDRYLDDDIALHPPETHGSNGRDAYADLAATRQVSIRPRLGIGARLEEAWYRYGKPLVVGECHNGSTQEEQIRWLSDVWQQAQAARDRGVDIRAVTLWSLVGAMDWDSLLTRRRGHYERGAFDVSAGMRCKTALAHAAAQLAATGVIEHPVLNTPGWWARTEHQDDESSRRMLILAGNAPAATASLAVCEARGVATQAAAGAALRRFDAARATANRRIWSVLICETPGSARPLLDALHHNFQRAGVPVERLSPGSTSKTASALIDKLINRAF